MRYAAIGTMLRTLRIAPLVVLLGSAACKKDGATPSFLRINAPRVIGSGNTTLTSNITEMWVYQNDQPVGVWRADRRIPVLASGTVNIKLIAGIHRNGVSDDHLQYLFYDTYSQSVDLTLGEEVSITPTFHYYTNVTFWYEGFEDGSLLTDDEGAEPITFYHTPADSAHVLTGQSSAGFVLDPDHASFRAVSSGDPSFPNGAVPTFLELDYRSNMRFLVGVRYDLNGQTQTVPYLYVAPTGTDQTNMSWKHIYIDLGAAWNPGGGTNKRFYLEGALENGATSGEVTFDNVKGVFQQ